MGVRFPPPDPIRPVDTRSARPYMEWLLGAAAGCGAGLLARIFLPGYGGAPWYWSGSLGAVGGAGGAFFGRVLEEKIGGDGPLTLMLTLMGALVFAVPRR